MEPANTEEEPGPEPKVNDEITFLLEYGGSTLPDLDVSGKKRRRKSKSSEDAGQASSTSASSSNPNSKNQNEKQAIPGSRNNTEQNQASSNSNSKNPNEKQAIPGSRNNTETNQASTNSKQATSDPNQADSNNSRKQNNEESVRISKSRTNLLRKQNNDSIISEVARSRTTTELSRSDDAALRSAGANNAASRSAGANNAAGQNQNIEELDAEEGSDWSFGSNRRIIAAATVLTGVLIGYGLVKMLAFGEGDSSTESVTTSGGNTTHGEISNTPQPSHPRLAKCHLPPAK